MTYNYEESLPGEKLANRNEDESFHMMVFVKCVSVSQEI
jgi:hypothetical protein